MRRRSSIGACRWIIGSGPTTFGLPARGSRRSGRRRCSTPTRQRACWAVSIRSRTGWRTERPAARRMRMCTRWWNGCSRRSSVRWPGSCTPAGRATTRWPPTSGSGASTRRARSSRRSLPWRGRCVTRPPRAWSWSCRAIRMGSRRSRCAGRMCCWHMPGRWFGIARA